MIVEVYIIDRIYQNIEAFCRANGKNLLEYMGDAIIDRYNLDRYGDLNEKIIKKVPSKTIAIKEEKENTVSVVSKSDTNKEETSKVITNEIEATVVPSEEAPKTKKTKRTLKVK